MSDIGAKGDDTLLIEKEIASVTEGIRGTSFRQERKQRK